jgi:hypothetical protein
MFPLLILLVLCSFSSTLAAAPASPDGGRLGVRPILPDNQIQGIAGYFNLKMKPGVAQTVYLEVSNRTNAPVTVCLTPAYAVSSPQSGILYQSEINSDDYALLDDAPVMSGIIAVPAEATIGAASAVKVPVTLTVPETACGTLLGGILVCEKQADAATVPNPEKTVFSVRTQIAYAIAVQMELPQADSVCLAVGQSDFDPTTGKLYFELINRAARLEKNISGRYQVLNSRQEILFEDSFESLTLTPKTRMRYYLPWDSQTLAAGSYTLSVQIAADDTILTAAPTFKIDSREIKEYIENYQPPTVETPASPLIWVILAAAAVVIILLLLFNLRRQNHRKKSEKPRDS